MSANAAKSRHHGGVLMSDVPEDLDDGQGDALAQRLLALHEASPLLVALFDDQDLLRYANPAFCQFRRTTAR